MHAVPIFFDDRATAPPDIKAHVAVTSWTSRGPGLAPQSYLTSKLGLRKNQMQADWRVNLASRL